MTENRLVEMEERLAHVPKGTLLIERRTPGHGAPFLSEGAAAISDGKGIVRGWNVFPGIALTYSIYRASHCGFRHVPLASVMQISHCRSGRAGWRMHDGTNIYLGPGDISFHRMDACAESATDFPLGYYEGMAMMVDADRLEREPPEILREAGIDGKGFCRKFCASGGCTAMPASPQIHRVFSELYALPPCLQLPYIKLKVQELLLFLSMLEPEKEKRLDPYLSQQVEIIQAIHRQLTEHLDQRFTIEALSKRYLINTSSLKAIFKRVYGAPVATYMKEYRIRKAAELLRETGDSVADVAARVGYENQSKFTAAFKEQFHLPPTAYRKQYRSPMV